MNAYPAILSKFLHRPRPAWLANEARPASVTLFLPNQLSPVQSGQDHWVQLSPFGDFANATGASRVIQRFRHEDARHICDEFNSTIRRVTQPLGMPFYIGHPDHPRFKGQPGHADTRAYGRGKEMQVRHDPACPACAAFANATSDTPCQDHGLFVKMHWNDDGARLISNESFHGHSVNWAAVPDGMEKGVQVFRPIRVKSAGFTNEPNIPVRPASLANSDPSDHQRWRGTQPAQPSRSRPRLKLHRRISRKTRKSPWIRSLPPWKKRFPVDKANEINPRRPGETARKRAPRPRHLPSIDSTMSKTGRVISQGPRLPASSSYAMQAITSTKLAANLGECTHPARKNRAAQSKGLAGHHAKVGRRRARAHRPPPAADRCPPAGVPQRDL